MAVLTVAYHVDLLLARHAILPNVGEDRVISVGG